MQAAQNVVVATCKTFETKKENNWLNKHLVSMEKRISEFEKAHKALLEAFERVKELYKKTKVELRITKLDLKEEKKAAAKRELGQLSEKKKKTP